MQKAAPIYSLEFVLHPEQDAALAEHGEHVSQQVHEGSRTELTEQIDDVGLFQEIRSSGQIVWCYIGEQCL